MATELGRIGTEIDQLSKVLRTTCPTHAYRKEGENNKIRQNKKRRTQKPNGMDSANKSRRSFRVFALSRQQFTFYITNVWIGRPGELI